MGEHNHYLHVIGEFAQAEPFSFVLALGIVAALINPHIPTIVRLIGRRFGVRNGANGRRTSSTPYGLANECLDEIKQISKDRVDMRRLVEKRFDRIEERIDEGNKRLGRIAARVDLNTQKIELCRNRD